MTEVWKVVKENNEILESAIVDGTAWSYTYKKNEITQFCRFAPGLAFNEYTHAKKFCELHKQHKGILQIWKATADVLPHPVNSILPYLFVTVTNPGWKNPIAVFWKSNRWHEPGDAYVKGGDYIADAPEGTVACLSITLLERCDD